MVKISAIKTKLAGRTIWNQTVTSIITTVQKMFCKISGHFCRCIQTNLAQKIFSINTLYLLKPSNSFKWVSQETHTGLFSLYALHNATTKPFHSSHHSRVYEILYLCQKVFLASCGMVEPLYQQSMKLFQDQKSTFHLPGALSCTAVR